MKNRDYQFKPNHYVNAYRKSGFPRRAFARAVGVPEYTLREWEKRASSKSELPKPATKSGTKADATYDTIMLEINNALGSIKNLKKILTNI